MWVVGRGWFVCPLRCRVRGVNAAVVSQSLLLTLSSMFRASASEETSAASTERSMVWEHHSVVVH